MVNFQIIHFENLNIFQWQELLMLRAEVFVVEQNCAYQDPDLIDFESFHLMAADELNLIGTARIYASKYEQKLCWKIGRVAIKKSARMYGSGKSLMQACLTFCKQKNESFPIVISAQQYLDKFYSDLGFIATGKQYLEDNIPHQEMIFDK